MILKNINEKTESQLLQEQYDKILKQSKIYDEDISKFKTEQEQDAYLATILGSSDKANELVGDLREFIKDTSKFPISDIIPKATLFFVEEEVKNLTISYNEFDKVIRKQPWQNGSIVFDYKDYTDADNTKAYSDTIIPDFNGELNPIGREYFIAAAEKHKKMKMLSNVLNNVSKNISLFVAWLKDYQLQIVRPMAKERYKARLQQIANPFLGIDLNDNGITTTISDWVVKGTIKETQIAFKNIFQSLRQPSRDHTNRKEMIPTQLTEQLERQITDDFIIIAPIGFENMISVELYANAFNMSQLELRQKIVSLDYAKTFEEYGKVKGLNYKDQKKFDIFIIQAGLINEGTFYEAQVDTQTPKLYNILHSYSRFGYAIDKSKLFIKITLEITDYNPVIPTRLDPNNPTGKKDLSVDLTTTALGELPTASKENVLKAVKEKNPNVDITQPIAFVKKSNTAGSLTPGRDNEIYNVKEVDITFTIKASVKNNKPKPETTTEPKPETTTEPKPEAKQEAEVEVK